MSESKSRETFTCPNCGTAIRATNVEYFYEDYGGEHDDQGQVIPTPLEMFEDVDPEDGVQLWYCPAPPEKCRVTRLFPGQDDEPDSARYKGDND